MTFTTPPGTSDVATTSDRVMAGRGRGSLASTTAALPETMTGASRLTSPSSEESWAPRSPPRRWAGDREVEVRPADRVHVAQDLGELVGPAGVPHPSVNGRVHQPSAALEAHALGRANLGDGTHRAAPPSAPRCGTEPGSGSRPTYPPIPAGPCARRAQRHGCPSASRGRRSPAAHRPRRGPVRPPGLGARELAADEQLVRLPHVQSVGCLALAVAQREGRRGRRIQDHGRAVPRPAGRLVAAGRRRGFVRRAVATV